MVRRVSIPSPPWWDDPDCWEGSACSRETPAFLKQPEFNGEMLFIYFFLHWLLKLMSYPYVSQNVSYCGMLRGQLRNRPLCCLPGGGCDVRFCVQCPLVGRTANKTTQLLFPHVSTRGRYCIVYVTSPAFTIKLNQMDILDDKPLRIINNS